MHTLQGHTDIVYSAEFSADGFSTGECMQTLQGHTDIVNSAYSPQMVLPLVSACTLSKDILTLSTLLILCRWFLHR
jgi:WD40 repeat protein